MRTLRNPLNLLPVRPLGDPHNPAYIPLWRLPARRRGRLSRLVAACSAKLRCTGLPLTLLTQCRKAQRRSLVSVCLT